MHYTAFGRVWYGAKYSHRVWERFAHTFEKSFFLLKSRSVNYLFSGLFSTFSGIWEPEKWELTFFGPIFDFFQIYERIGIIRRIIDRIWCHSPNYWPTVVGIIGNIIRYGQKSIFCIIRLLAGFGMVRNTPTGCGNNLPILLRSISSLK